MKKMKKLKSALVLAVVLAAMLGMHVLAAGSTNANVKLKKGYEGQASRAKAAYSDQALIDIKIDSVDYEVSQEAKENLEEVLEEALWSSHGRYYDYEITSTTFFRMPIWDKTNNEYRDLVSLGSDVEMTLEVPYVTSESVVVLVGNYQDFSWTRGDVTAVRDGEMDVVFDDFISSEFVLVTLDITSTGNQESNSSSSGSSSGGSSSDSSSESDSSSGSSSSFESPVSAGGSQTVQIGNISAGIQIGPSTKTFYERDAKILFGTDNPCSVYLMDLWLFDPATGGNVPLGSEGAEITLNVPNVNPNCRVVVRHWLNGTDEYEDLIPTVVGDGYITVKFTSLSPIAIIVEQVEPTPGATATAATSGKVSPKTAEGSVIYVVEMLAVVSLLGFVICRRSVKR